jgi:hypothetical protein
VSYDPKPGTAAFRLLAALEARPHGEEVMSSRLAELAGVDPICVVGSLTAARTAGVVFARKKGATERSPVFWSLVDHASAPNPAPSGSSASTPGDSDDDEGNGGRPRRVAGRGDDGRPAGGRNDDREQGDRAAEPGAGLLRAQPPRVAHQGNAAPDLTSAEPAPAAASCLRIALWSDGTLQIQRAAGNLTLSRDETRQLVAYLDSIALDGVRETAE